MLSFTLGRMQLQLVHGEKLNNKLTWFMWNMDKVPIWILWFDLWMVNTTLSVSRHTVNNVWNLIEKTL
jgi:hypothetical protein